jgi:tetratricopeptide (TPR) repeat protein
MPRSLSWLIALAALGSTAMVQYNFDTAAADSRIKLFNAVRTSEQVLLPPANVLKLVSLGHPSLAADLVWLQAIQYFGNAGSNATYAALPDYLETVTTLDPKFAYPYQLGTVSLPFMNKADEAIALGEQGIREVPNDGMIAYYLATVYHLNRKDYQRAHEVYLLASEREGAPEAARILAGVVLNAERSSLNDSVVSILFWDNVYKTARSDAEKKIAERWREHMKIVYFLEQAAAKYSTDTGSYPESVETLVTSGYIDAIPKSPNGRLFIADPAKKAILFNKLDPDPYYLP